MRGSKPFRESLFVEFVHQKANGAAMHAVDRLARIHEPLQGRQHKAVAAKRDDDVGGLRPRVAIAAGQTCPCTLCGRRVAGDKRDAAITGGRTALWHTDFLKSAAQRRSTIDTEAELERAVFVYTTYPSVVEAEQAGRALVEQRLCACVNILPGMVSLYWWRGKIDRGEEVVMIIKTRASLAEPVRAAVKQMHSYSTPAILVLPVENVDPEYHAWIVAEARGERDD
jgi:periplasmic divalent cation tolerance protein